MNANWLPDFLRSHLTDTIILPEATLSITEPLLLDSLAGKTIDARRTTFMFPDGAPQRWLTFSGCDGLTWRGGDFRGACKFARVQELCKATNAAGKEPQASDFTHALCFNECASVTLDDPHFQGFDRALDLHRSPDFRLLRGNFVGIYDGRLSKFTPDGKLDVVAKDVLRSLYSVNVRNCARFTWTDGISRLGGAVVAGSGDQGGSSRFMRIERLQSYQTGDQAIYGSSTPYATVQDCELHDNIGGHGIKLRGDGCKIIGNQVFDSLYGIGVEGVGKTPDVLGAAAFGQTISFNYLLNCTDNAIAVDQTASGNLYPRHLIVSHNQIHDCATQQHYAGKPINPPIYLEGGHGYLVDHNVVAGYAHEAFLFLGAPSGNSRIGFANVTSKRPRILIGAGVVDLTPFGQAF